MIVKKTTIDCTDLCSVPSQLDKLSIPFEVIGCVNWKEQFPYKPLAKFRIVHTDSAIIINYRVNEKSIRAKYDKDCGNVWTDSCVEFFSIPANDGVYYNIECNCIGTILLAAGKERENREKAPISVLKQIERWASLGTKALEERKGDCSWEIVLRIPYTAYFKHQIDSLGGKRIRANFYKCGDELETPHFLSWNPIEIAKPDFQRPDYFGTLDFE